MKSLIALSLQKPTSISHSIVVSFTDINESNLILAKANILEIFSLTPQGLKPQFNISLNGKIAALKTFRSTGNKTEFIVIVTSKLQVSIIYFDKASKEIVTSINGNLRDPIGRLRSDGFLLVIDPLSQIIALHIYDGLIGFIPIHTNGQLGQQFNVRVEEQRIIDITFLFGFRTPVICILYEDYQGMRYVRTYDVLPEAFALSPCSSFLLPISVSKSASHLLPISSPYFGVIVLCGESIVYISPGVNSNDIASNNNSIYIPVRIPFQQEIEFKQEEKEIDEQINQGEIKNTRFFQSDKDNELLSTYETQFKNNFPQFFLQETQFLAWTNISGSDYLIGDIWGHLLLLSLSQNQTIQNNIKSRKEKINYSAQHLSLSLIYIGITSIPSSYAYLDNGYVYIASSYGDSQLIQIQQLNNIDNVQSTIGTNDQQKDKQNKQKLTLKIMENFINIGPIVDFVVANIDNEEECKTLLPLQVKQQQQFVSENNGNIQQNNKVINSIQIHKSSQRHFDIKQIITCSGGFKDGSIRILRSGISISTLVTDECECLSGLWSIQDWRMYNVNGINISNQQSENIYQENSFALHRFLIQSFPGATRTLELSGNGEFNEIIIEGLDQNSESIYCGTIKSTPFDTFLHSFNQINELDHYIVQVTVSSVFLIDYKGTEFLITSSMQKINENQQSKYNRILTWNPNNVELEKLPINLKFDKDVRITAAFTIGGYLILGLSGGILLLLQIKYNEGRQRYSNQGIQLQVIAYRTLPGDISCINAWILEGLENQASSLPTPSTGLISHNLQGFVIAGIWGNNSLSAMKLPTLEQIWIKDLCSNSIPRSCIFIAPPSSYYNTDSIIAQTNNQPFHTEYLSRRNLCTCSVCSNIDQKDKASKVEIQNESSFSKCFLLIGMGDGQLITYRICPKTGVMSERREYNIATYPLLLSPFTTQAIISDNPFENRQNIRQEFNQKDNEDDYEVNDLTKGKQNRKEISEVNQQSKMEQQLIIQNKSTYIQNQFLQQQQQHVFICADRPAIVSLRYHQPITSDSQTYLEINSINANNISLVAPFSTSLVPDALFIATDKELIFGCIDPTQRIQTRTLHLHEMPRRLCVDRQLGAIVVGTHRTFPSLFKIAQSRQKQNLKINNTKKKNDVYIVQENDQNNLNDENMRFQYKHQNVLLHKRRKIGADSDSEDDQKEKEEYYEDEKCKSDAIKEDQFIAAHDQDFIHSIDIDTLQLQHTFALDSMEVILSLISIPLSINGIEQKSDIFKKQSKVQDQEQNRKGMQKDNSDQLVDQENKNEDYQMKSVFIAVGTAFIMPDEVEASRGRIILFHLRKRTLFLDYICSIDVNGAVYQLAPLTEDGLLVAAINNRIAILQLRIKQLLTSSSQFGSDNSIQQLLMSKGKLELNRIAQRSVAVMSIALHIYGRYICVGDIARSLSLYIYNPNQHTLEAVAADCSARWIFDACFFTIQNQQQGQQPQAQDNLIEKQKPSSDLLDDNIIFGYETNVENIIIGSDDRGNILIFQRGGEAAAEAVATATQSSSQSSPSGMLQAQFSQKENQGIIASKTAVLKSQRLDCMGSFHIGGTINRICNGSISKPGTPPILSSVLAATSDGGIHLLVSLPHSITNFATKLESLMANVLHGVGHLPHTDWRAPDFGGGRCSHATGVIDGDFIERFLELDTKQKRYIIEKMGMSEVQIQQMIEIIQQLH